MSMDQSETFEWMRSELDRLRSQLQQREKELSELRSEQDTEIGRWQKVIYDLLVKNCGDAIDGGGCDSGDPLDFTLSEISQGLAILADRAEQAESALQGLREQVGEATKVLQAALDDAAMNVAIYPHTIRIVLAIIASAIEGSKDAEIE